MVSGAVKASKETLPRAPAWEDGLSRRLRDVYSELEDGGGASLTSGVSGRGWGAG